MTTRDKIKDSLCNAKSVDRMMPSIAPEIDRLLFLKGSEKTVDETLDFLKGSYIETLADVIEDTLTQDEVDYIWAIYNNPKVVDIHYKIEQASEKVDSEAGGSLLFSKVNDFIEGN